MVGLGIRIWLVLVLTQGSTLPPKLQAALFAKILAFDRTLQAVEGPPHVAVLYSDSDAESSTHALLIAKEFQNAGLAATAVESSTLGEVGAKMAVVYVADENQLPFAMAACEKHKLLSISPDPELVTRGLVSVGASLGSNRRPKIVVHLTRVAAEGHDLSSKLLRMAEIIR